MSRLKQKAALMKMELEYIVQDYHEISAQSPCCNKAVALAAVITIEGALTAHKYFITVPQSIYDSWICMVIGMYTP